MKKKTILITVILATVLLLSACAKNRNSDVYFVHAVCFEEQDGGVVIHAVSEKQAGDKSESEKNGGEYSVISAEGRTPDTAAKSFFDKYKNVYFATSEIYIFKDSSSVRFIKDVSEMLCDSSVFPVKSSVIMTNKDDAEGLLRIIGNSKDIKRLLHLSKRDKTNIVSFFAKVNEGKGCTVPIIGIDESGKADYIEKNAFGEDESNE